VEIVGIITSYESTLVLDCALSEIAMQVVGLGQIAPHLGDDLGGHVGGQADALAQRALLQPGVQESGDKGVASASGIHTLFHALRPVVLKADGSGRSQLLYVVGDHLDAGTAVGDEDDLCATGLQEIPRQFIDISESTRCLGQRLELLAVSEQEEGNAGQLQHGLGVFPDDVGGTEVEGQSPPLPHQVLHYVVAHIAPLGHEEALHVQDLLALHGSQEALTLVTDGVAQGLHFELGRGPDVGVQRGVILVHQAQTLTRVRILDGLQPGLDAAFPEDRSQLLSVLISSNGAKEEGICAQLLQDAGGIESRASRICKALGARRD